MELVNRFSPQQLGKANNEWLLQHALHQLNLLQKAALPHLP
jgi:hypothetical protein